MLNRTDQHFPSDICSTKIFPYVHRHGCSQLHVPNTCTSNIAGKAGKTGMADRADRAGKESWAGKAELAGLAEQVVCVRGRYYQLNTHINDR